MQTSGLAKQRQILAWAFYDWANSAFATAVIAGFFPIFFKQYWSADIDVTVSTFRLGIANSVASLMVLSVAPILGAIADRGALKKRLLLTFAFVGMVAAGAMSWVDQGEWQSAVVLYVVAGVGFGAANIFYDALIVDVSDDHHLDQVSALGFGLGYLGGGLFFAFCVAMTIWPQAFGLNSANDAVKISFLLVALWWGLFTLPMARVVRERQVYTAVSLGQAVVGGFQQLRDTARKIRQYRPVLVFLLAYWLYIDGVDTIVRMAVDYGLALGFDAQDLIVALLIVQFVGFPAAIIFGWVGQRLGARNGILIGLAAYMGITVWSYHMDQPREFYAIAVAIGLVQGGVQSLSRSFYARLIPRNEAAEFFGFYNLLGKFAAVIGPLLMGWVAVATGSTRISILSLLILFAAGMVLLLRVQTGKVSATSKPSSKND